MVQTQLQSPDKSPSPQPFKEPENMMTIELNKNGYFVNDVDDIIKTQTKLKLSKITKVLLIGFGLFFFGLLCITMTFLLMRGHFKTPQNIDAGAVFNPKEVSLNHLSKYKDKFGACKLSKNFEDCCYIFLKTDLFNEIEKCTVEKVLNLFLQYELQANKRVKRQDYKNFDWETPFNVPSEQLFTDPNQFYQSNYYQQNVYNEEYQYPEPSNYDQENSYQYGYDNTPQEVYQNKMQESLDYYPQSAPSDIAKIYYNDYNQNEQNKDRVTKQKSSTQNISFTTEKDKKNNSKEQENMDPIVKEAESWTSSTILPKTCPDDNCPTVVNATTKIANITNISAHLGSVKIDMNNTNIKLTPKFNNSSRRISQGVDFDNKPTMEIQTSSQSKQTVNPCFYPFSTPFIPPYRASSSFDSNQLFTMMPMNSQHQPLYVINPPMYPYIPMQYPGYNYPNPSMINKNPIQAAGVGGQYFMCNPVSLPPNSLGLPGVEVRRMTEAFTLQDLVESTIKTPKSNKTREAMDCPIGEHGCNDGSKCVHDRQLCDNEVDCADGSDEIGCSCKNRVWEMRWCDVYLDCPNGEDEEGCFGCEKDEFSCDDWSKFRRGTCIPMNQRCDGIRNCEVTGKDEEDCTILTDHLSHHPLYKISNAAGFLHRNYKGKWYPTCFGADIFALDVCRTEAGPSGILPKTHLMSSNDNYAGLFVDISPNAGVTLADSCLNNKAAFVECPPIFCGLRLTINNPFRSTEIDTSAEELLNHMQRVGNKSPSLDEIVSSSRVVGGKPSQPAAWPWVVSIYKNGIFHCGGVLINELWIATAAHCIDRFWYFYYEIQSGTLRRFSYSPMEQNRWVAAAIPHEAYNKRSLKNDIALLKLSKPLRFNRYVRPICLPSEVTAGEDFFRGPKPNTVCVTVGWGATVEHGTDPDHLREVEVPILPHCKHIEDQEGDEICAGLLEGGKDACQGDSGGPLMCQNVKNRSQWYLAGIVSHGEGCARPNEPGVYTKVSKYIGWIEENINGKIIGRFPLQKCPGYTCKGTGRCLPKKRHCDKIIDCLFGDDEIDCWRSNHGHNSLFRSPIVIGSQRSFFSHLIDLLNDSSDEDNNKKEKIGTQTIISKGVLETAALPDTFTCRNMLQVIPFDERCNKVINCEDGTDESDCLCADYIRRLHKEAICDGVTDCKDLSDESDCVKCFPGQHLCRTSQKCVPLEKRCDGRADCFRAEDEWDCVALTDGVTLVFDSDLRPKQSMKGIITINRFGVWRPLCTNASTDNTASIATNVCNLLGFEEYTAFHKLSVRDKPLNVTIDGFRRNYSSLDELQSAVCSGLFVACLEASTHELHRDNITSQVELYTSPWNAVIYLDGKFKCTGTVLNTHWIITTIACFGGTSPTASYIAVLLGKGKAHLDVEGPHEQAISITKIAFIAESDAIILRTQQKINFSRYVKPTRITARSASIREKCVAIGFGHERSQFVFLESLKNCTPGFRCFRSMVDFCEGTSQSWSGVITCDSRDGWYPAALFNDVRGACEFSNREFASIDRNKVKRAIDGDDEKVNPQECDGFRCILGQCIERRKVCDGIADCRRGEDEDLNLCSKFESDCHLSNTCMNHSPCRWTEFKCRNGSCIPKSSFCDTINDCGDHFDEPAVCSCKTYLERVHPEKICDGTVNCWDRSDEDPRKCNCQFPTNITCHQTELCISKEMVCDGFKDCPGGDDESTCYSLRTNFSRVDSGEVMRRTAGVWHSGCFTRNHTTSELEEICERLGFAGGSARQLIPPEDMDNVTMMNPVRDRFDVVWIRRARGNKLRLRLRTGNEPYVKFMKDSACHKLFIECL